MHIKASGPLAPRLTAESDSLNCVQRKSAICARPQKFFEIIGVNSSQEAFQDIRKLIQSQSTLSPTLSLALTYPRTARVKWELWKALQCILPEQYGLPVCAGKRQQAWVLAEATASPLSAELNQPLQGSGASCMKAWIVLIVARVCN